MPIIETLSTELREAVPTVGIIQVVFIFLLGQKTTSTVMAHNLDWLILTMDQSSTLAVTIMCGKMRQEVSCCSYSQREST